VTHIFTKTFIVSALYYTKNTRKYDIYLFKKTKTQSPVSSSFAAMGVNVDR